MTDDDQPMVYIVTATNEQGGAIRYATDDLRVASLATELLKQRGVAEDARVERTAILLNSHLPTFLRVAEEILLSADVRARRVIEDRLTEVTESVNEVLAKLRRGSEDADVIEQAWHGWRNLKALRVRLPDDSDDLRTTIAEMEAALERAFQGRM